MATQDLAASVGRERTRRLGWLAAATALLLALIVGLYWFAQQKQAALGSRYEPAPELMEQPLEWLLAPRETNRFLRPVPSLRDVAGVSEVPNLKSVHFASDGLRGWAVGDGGTILATDNGGRSWAVQARDSRSWLNCVTFASDGLRGWVVGNDGTVLATDNGGRSWALQTNNSKSWLNSVTFASDGLRGWAVGMSGAILATDNGGRSWAVQTNNSKSVLASVTFASDGLRGWAVGSDGNILATDNGGLAWTGQASNSKSMLTGVTFARDGLRGWSVGDGGTILATDNGGRSWALQTNNSKSWLTSVTFASDGLRGWAVSDAGTVLATDNGGRSWAVQTSDTTARLTSVTFASDNLRGWIVGDDSTILATTNGGKTWHQAATYSRSPAPWFYLASVALLLVFARATLPAGWRRDLAGLILAHPVADGPIDDSRHDRLRFTPIVEALASFLRHDATRPPLAIAITAPWGRGKSSMMAMLRQRLDRLGGRTVWFNAWHHQKDAVALAALLGVLQREAPPPWFSLAGLRFRFWLVVRRWRRAPFLTALPALMALVLLFGPLAVIGGSVLDRTGSFKWLAGQVTALAQALPSHPAVEQLFAGNWAGFFKASLGLLGSEPSRVLGPLAACLVVVVSVAYLLLYLLRSFPDRPGVLLATLGKDFSTRVADEQTTFRARFREHFADVCEALRPGTLTVFIDDLDRCSPDTCAEVLEAVNFLVTSGNCFVVLGVAREIVEAQLGKHFTDLATLLPELESARRGEVPAADSPPAPDSTPAARQLAYAQAYLRKLVQIEIPVPALSAEAGAALLRSDEDDGAEEASHGLHDAHVRLRARQQAQRCARAERWVHRLDLGFAGFRWVARAAVVGWLVGWIWINADPWLGQLKKQEASRQTETRNTLMAHESTERPKLIAYVEWLKRSPAPVTPKPGDAKLAGELAALAKENNAARISEAERRLKKVDEQLDRLSAAADQSQHGLFAEREAQTTVFLRETLDWIGKDEAYALHLEAGRKSVSAPNVSTQPREPAPLRDVPAASGEPAPVDDDSGPSLVWLPVAVLITLAGWRGWRIWNESPRAAADRRYAEAVKVWQSLFMVEDRLRAPRELKRFLNLSRYVSVRLNLPVYRRQTLAESVVSRLMPALLEDLSATPSVSETSVVGLSALYLIKPKEVRVRDDVARFLSAPHADSFYLAGLAEKRPLEPVNGYYLLLTTRLLEIRTALVEPDSTEWEWSDSDVKAFLEVVSELRTDD
ncbi:YCF48-related protein [Derxia lacustris]|uniref:YCF48-related protein n=1 Tax=Derxia lacustris TaxID=764842 RepID=UPI000A16EA0A|nr:YCF48-related protein [Derxia lacustris]